MAEERKIVVLTGATRGLGRAMAETFSAAGHTVLGCGRTEKNVRDTQNALGPPHGVTRVDVTDDTAVARWAKACAESHGPPDLLINNAGIINANAPLWAVPGPEFDRLMDVNIKGVANVLRHFLPAMLDRGRGVIVNFSSGWGRSVSAEVAPYCASKWAMEGLTKALAEELPGNMAAVPFNPGVIDTDMLRSCFGDGAAGCPSPKAWARTAVPYLLKLGPRHNGQSVTAP